LSNFTFLQGSGSDIQSLLLRQNLLSDEERGKTLDINLKGDGQHLHIVNYLLAIRKYF
jgi:hypothetical protein